MKLCKDCIYFNPNVAPYPKCDRSSVISISPVTGDKMTIKHNSCEDERKPQGWFGRGCGPEGKYFEPTEDEKIPGIIRVVDVCPVSGKKTVSKFTSPQFGLLDSLNSLLMAIPATAKVYHSGIWCYEARIPVGLVEAAHAAIAKAKGETT
jgi:hypothetical protein